jgi:hypothetical protein
VAQVELAAPAAINISIGRRYLRIDVGGGQVVGGLACELPQTDFLALAIVPPDHDRAWGASFITYLRNDEMPLSAIALVVVNCLRAYALGAFRLARLRA